MSAVQFNRSRHLQLEMDDCNSECHVYQTVCSEEAAAAPLFRACTRNSLSGEHGPIGSSAVREKIDFSNISEMLTSSYHLRVPQKFTIQRLNGLARRIEWCSSRKNKTDTYFTKLSPFMSKI